MENYLKTFNKDLAQLARRYRVSEVFFDFCKMAAISLAQPFHKDEKLEAEYMETVGKYSKDEAQKFPAMLGTVVLALEERHRDFLGEAFMSNDMGNKYKGQFFTPYHVCKLVAQMAGPRNSDTLCEPCIGAGAMVIAAHEINPNIAYVEATDIDELCFYMAYIQLSLYGIPARVVHGNSLSLEHWRSLHTPGYFLTGRHEYDRMKRLIRAVEKVLEPVKEEAALVRAFPESR